MLIQELIDELEVIRESHGNIDVCHYNGREVDDVELDFSHRDEKHFVRLN